MQAIGTDGYIIRTKALTEPERVQLIGIVSENGARKIDERRFNSIGPTIGAELRSKAGWAIVCVILAIVLYICLRISPCFTADLLMDLRTCCGGCACA